MKLVGLFVDVSDLYTNIDRKYNGRKLDYKKYLTFAKGDNQLYRAIAYGGQIGNKSIDFITYLRYVGYEPKYKEYDATERKDFRANWDVGITIDIVTQLDRIDIVYLGSSSKRLIPLVDYIQSRGRICHIFACNINHDLLIRANSYTEITEDLLAVSKEDSEEESSTS